MTVALPVVLSGLAAAVAASPSSAALRARRLLPAVRGPAPRRPGQTSTGRSRQPLLASLVAALAVALLVGGRVGAILAVLLVVLGPRQLARLEPAASRRERERVAADLPLALDLLSSCLSGGGVVEDALRAVAGAVGGPCGARLQRVAAALSVGAGPAEAWQHLDPERADPLASAAARALGRAAETGTPVAEELVRLTARTRASAATRGRAAAERAAVLTVAPLGLCYLPAFVLVGVVPVVAGLLLPLLQTF